jgi:uncharacterized membrane protein (UPF0127 family)
MARAEPWVCMVESATKRLRGLPLVAVLGCEVPIATGFRARLFGLSHLDRKQAGPGLLIPRCSSVHTFGMRFPLDICFLGKEDKLLAVRPGAPARRAFWCRGAVAVLETPAEQGGEFSLLCP